MSENREDIRNPEEGLIDIVGILKEYLQTLRRMWIWVLILTVAGGGIFYARGFFSWHPVYTASATFTITASLDDGTDTAGSYRFYDNATAEQMVNTFPYILTSGVLSRRAAAEMGQENITGQIHAAAEDNTNLFELSVTDSDAGRAYETLQAVIKCYPEVAEMIIGRTNMQLLDETGIPAHPDNPRDGRRDLAKGAAGGCALGLVWTAFVMLSRQTIRKKEDFQKMIHMKCLGEVPQISVKKRSHKTKNILNILNEKTDPDFLEALRIIRNKVEYSAWKHKHKIILVTSALAGEGKSTLAVNLALSLALNGKKVALADCDLRHPSDREILGLEDGPGMQEILNRKIKVNDALMSAEKMGMDKEMHFYFLPGGEMIEDGSRLLGTGRMEKIIEVLAEKMDYVILDSAPVGMLTDAGVLAQFADSVVFVVKKDYARADHILEGMEELTGSRVHLIGGILNGV